MVLSPEMEMDTWTSKLLMLLLIYVTQDIWPFWEAVDHTTNHCIRPGNKSRLFSKHKGKFK